MLQKVTGLALVLLVGNPLAGSLGPGPDGPEDDSVVVVKMVEKSATSYAFEPSHIQVKPGMTIRFIQEGSVPHNVEFKDAPRGVDLGQARMGRFLLQKGDTYELTIDDRFAQGDYRFVCTPHEVMGMTGSLTVTSGS